MRPPLAQGSVFSGGKCYLSDVNGFERQRGREALICRLETIFPKVYLEGLLFQHTTCDLISGVKFRVFSFSCSRWDLCTCHRLLFKSLSSRFKDKKNNPTGGLTRKTGPMGGNCLSMKIQVLKKNTSDKKTFPLALPAMESCILEVAEEKICLIWTDGRQTR